MIVTLSLIIISLKLCLNTMTKKKAKKLNWKATCKTHDNPWCLNFESPIGKRSVGEIEWENK